MEVIESSVSSGIAVSYGFAILVGFALSAACGMRIFAPLAIVAVATHFGWINPGGGFAWIGSTPAVICFAVECVLEILGMLIPWLDHVLDVAGTPVAAVAGTVVMASQLAAVSGIDTSAYAIIRNTFRSLSIRNPYMIYNMNIAEWHHGLD